MLFINQYKKYEHKIKPKHKKNQKRQKNWSTRGKNHSLAHSGHKGSYNPL